VRIPDVPTFGVKSISSLDLIATCELLKHGIVVLGIVACDMADLLRSR
jgi:hypothetical protein